MINLQNCKKGDILLSKHGAILEFVRVLPETGYYDIEVKYLYADGKTDLGNGTRNLDGTVFKQNRKEKDHDIVAVYDRKELLKILKK